MSFKFGFNVIATVYFIGLILNIYFLFAPGHFGDADYIEAIINNIKTYPPLSINLSTYVIIFLTHFIVAIKYKSMESMSISWIRIILIKTSVLVLFCLLVNFIFSKSTGTNSIFLPVIILVYIFLWLGKPNMKEE